MSLLTIKWEIAARGSSKVTLLLPGWFCRNQVVFSAEIWWSPLYSIYIYIQLYIYAPYTTLYMHIYIYMHTFTCVYNIYIRIKLTFLWKQARNLMPPRSCFRCVCVYTANNMQSKYWFGRGVRHDCGTALNEATTIMGYWVWSTQRTCIRG